MGVNQLKIMKKILIIVFSIISNLAYSQKSAGNITYEYERNWLKIIEKDKFLTNDQKQRELQTSKNYGSWKTKMQLVFNSKGSYYGLGEEERGNSWQKTEYWIRRDFENNTVLETQMLSGKVYIVEDQMYSYSWKIKTEIKEIAGYLCMKATTYDSLRNYTIEAWFTTDIPASVGPEEFMGLPGAILEVIIDEGIATISATSVKLNENANLPPLPKKIKGKRYTKADYDLAKSKYLKDMEEAREMPWGLRY